MVTISRIKTTVRHPHLKIVYVGPYTQWRRQLWG